MNIPRGKPHLVPVRGSFQPSEPSRFGTSPLSTARGSLGTGAPAFPGARPGTPLGGLGWGSAAVAERVPRTGGDGAAAGDGMGQGSRGAPSWPAGRRGVPLPVPLLGRVVQLVVSDQRL